MVLGSAWWESFLSTVVGGLLAIAGGAFASWLSWKRERKSVAAAFAAEVQGILDIYDWRHTIERIPQGWKFSVEPNFPVFESHVGKIGLLPTDLAAKVTVFYNYAAGVFMDFKAIYKDEVPQETLPRFRERFVNKIETMLMKRQALVPKLQKEAGGS
jgi:hypothetical protein